MIAFEIHVNGKKLCTAGLREFGNLCAYLCWSRGPHVAKETAFQHDFELAELVVAAVKVRYKSRNAPGLKAGFKYMDHLEWVRRKFKPGDEVVIRAVESSSVDKPVKRRPAGRTNDTMRAYKRQIRGVCKYFGWKIQT